MKKLSRIAVCALTAAGLAAAPAMAKNARQKEGYQWKPQKNIIFMVPDGMGLSNVTAARIFKNGPNGDRLNFETLDNIGYQSTHSLNATVTDSAAAASAWAMGKKYDNNEVSCHAATDGDNCENAEPTILERARAQGLATGLVATSQISHATPAAFGSHVHSRCCGTEIARQYLEDVEVDVVLGGGVLDTRTNKDCQRYGESYIPDKDASRSYIVGKAGENGYVLVANKAELNAAVASREPKVFGMFEQAGLHNGKTPEHFHVDGSAYPDGEPTLAEMTSAALDILEEDADGFFLLVEGSQIDWENHANNLPGQIAETLGFDAAVKVIQDWVNAKPMRRLTTQIIVVADHDCGGFALNGPGGVLSETGNIVEAGWTSGDHTATDTIVYSQGPQTWKLNKAVDNTYLYNVMKEYLEP